MLTQKIRSIGTWAAAALTVVFTLPAPAQFLQAGAKLVASDAIGASEQGISVALSGDGNTAIAGGDWDSSAKPGAAWIWTRSGGVWTQSAKLIGSGVGSTQVGQGYAVALSADGSTAMVGGPLDGQYQGAAWVFVRKGSSWVQQGSKLVGTATGGAYQGTGVALSADGNTAVIGGPSDSSGTGAAWVWTRTGDSWSQQAKLMGSGSVGTASQGSSVALSADGNTAVVGGRGDNGSAGALWVFTRSGNVWSQQGAKLVAPNTSGQLNLGASVALSADGDTLIGGSSHPTGQVASGAWVWVRSAGVWQVQSGRLVGSGEVVVTVSTQGCAVALSGDGNTAIAGAYQDARGAGAAWVWKRSGGAWTQSGAKLVGSGYSAGGANQGMSVALSADGMTALIGGALDNLGVGAVWVFGIPDLNVSASHSGGFQQGGTGAYSITVANVGTASTSGTVVAEDTLPTGFTATAVSGAGWRCTLTPVACSRQDALAAGGSYPAIGVTVALDGNAPLSSNNAVSVSGGGDGNLANNTVSGLTQVVAMPDMTITVSHTGDFATGDSGKQYLLTVRNRGDAASTGLVSVVDTLPAGLPATSMAGSGWICTLASLTCRRTDALAAGAEYPAITLTVDVVQDAPSNVTNSAVVSGGGELSTANNFSSDPTTVIPRAAVKVAELLDSAGYQNATLAPEGLFTVFGSNLAAGTVAAESLAQASLGGTSVAIRDSAGVKRQSSLFFVSPAQINFQAPTGLAAGPGTLTITNGEGATVSLAVRIEAVSPGLFSAAQNGSGVAAAVVTWIRGDGEVTTALAANWDASADQWLPTQIDVSGAAGDAYLSLYGTGLRGRSSLNGVSATIAGVPVDVLYAGAQPDYAGLDQVNLRLPASLAGKGDAQIRVTVDGRACNPVSVNIR